MKKGPGKPLTGAIAEAWKKVLLNEVEGREFYRMAAANARLDGVRQMFTFLMAEEERHHEAILEQIARMAEGKAPRLARKAAEKRAIRKFEGCRHVWLSEHLTRRNKERAGQTSAHEKP